MEDIKNISSEQAQGASKEAEKTTIQKITCYGIDTIAIRGIGKCYDKLWVPEIRDVGTGTEEEKQRYCEEYQCQKGEKGRVLIIQWIQHENKFN